MVEKLDYAREREGLVDFIESNLTKTEDSGMDENPLSVFHIGYLRPINKPFGKKDEKSPTEAKSRHTVGALNSPSSAGFSFYITEENIHLSIEFGATCFALEDSIENTDQSSKKKFKWAKIVLSPNENCIDIRPPSKNKVHQVVTAIFASKKENQPYLAKLYQVWRPYKKGFLLTLILTNQQDTSSSKIADTLHVEKTLFDVLLKCTVLKGRVESYPQKDFSLLCDEEKELELRYKDVKTYAIGHAAAVDWRYENKYFVLQTSFMPKVEVPSVTANTAGSRTQHLNFKFLSTCFENPDVFAKLGFFAKEYQNWIVNQHELATQMSPQEQEIAKRILDRAKQACNRIKDGIAFLCNDEKARCAFAFMNKVMLKQMVATQKKPDFDNYNWRPFQLAFVLMVIKSAVDENDVNRDLVDLIWFPTGGGKTEAYLGIMVLLFVYRRLRYPESQNSTVAIMRYTLRLLTGQQFIRAAKVICALELIRRQHENLLGTTPFSLGVWVGRKSTPNHFCKAKQELENQNYEKLGITSCPWCKAPFDSTNYICEKNRFDFICTNQECEFGASTCRVLPCRTIDEALYQHPPTLLLATVDKFAMLAWESRASVFFGGKGNRPPELIIQDELHLISGAIGSIAGLYEVGIEAALIKRGIYPKYIAATATIRNVKEQARLLYGKSAAVFPPSGLKHDDSFFAKTVPLEQKPGRIYVGYMAFAKSKRESLESLSANIATAPDIYFYAKPDFKDAWWTQLVYHSSLKGVARSDASFKDAIPRLISQKLSGFAETQALIENKKPKLTRILNVKSLTSNQGMEKNNQTFSQLTLSWEDSNAIDVALATNMVSVGLDVERLAIMIINGQPLTTSEYIQASSRVGRADIPGIVFVNYYQSQTSSLSHYENFRSYHESFYRYVEPTSLTPFTYQALKKALHAALIVAVRMSDSEFTSNSGADKFRASDKEIQKILKIVKHRIENAIEGPFSSELQEQEKEIKLKTTLTMLDNLVADWEKQAVASINSRRLLYYHTKERSADSLIDTHDSPRKSLWRALTSMRDVEAASLVKTLRGLKDFNG